MKRQIVATDAAPKAIGPYSQAVWAGDLLFCAGQIAFEPATGNMFARGIAYQVLSALENIRGRLQAQRPSFGNVVRSTIFLSYMNNFGSINEMYAKYFAKEPPSRST